MHVHDQAINYQFHEAGQIRVSTTLRVRALAINPPRGVGAHNVRRLPLLEGRLPSHVVGSVGPHIFNKVNALLKSPYED